jgi:hypothetical protein
MAVSANDLVIGPIIPANGVSLISLDFFFEDETLLQVFKTGDPDPLVLGVDYTVAGEGTESGSVTLTTPANGTDQYAIFLVPELERTSDLQLRGQFQSGPFNVELDRVWQALQSLNTKINRALLLSETSVPVTPLIAESAAARAGKVPIFAEDGISLELGPTGTEVSNAEAAAAAAAAAQSAAEAAAAAAELKEASMVADRGAWVTATAYAPSDLYTFDGQTYITEVAHTSSSVAADLAASKVRIFAAKGTSGAGTGDMLKSENLAGLADNAAARSNLGAQTVAANLTDIAALSLVNGDLITKAAGAIARLPITAGQYIRGNAGGTALEYATPPSGGARTLATPLDTSAGPNFFDFTGIPTDTTWIDVLFSSYSSDAAGDIRVRIGTGGVTVSTGYVSSSGNRNDEAHFTDGFGIKQSASGNVSGIMQLRKLGPASNIWVSSHAMRLGGSTAPAFGGGRVALAGALDILRIIQTGDADAGSVSIQYGA